MQNMLSLLACIFFSVSIADDHVQRHQGDIQALDDHGAYVEVTDDGASPDKDPSTPDRRVASIYIDEEWVGGDDGLVAIERIFSDAPDPKPVVYILGRPKISVEKLHRLKTSLPAASVRVRARVVLGIMSAGGPPHKDGVLVASVLPDSPAANAGIKVGDVITRMNESEIEDFAAVVAYLSQKQHEEVVVITVLRDAQLQEISVKLRGWIAKKKEESQRTKR
ncbi:MAG: PDZ domain-containing protein [Planctomycetaceae bacterium]